MKKLILWFLKKQNAILMILLALLGFSNACERSPDEYGSVIMEYGVPHATFIVNGTILNAKDGKEIPAIRVVMRNDTTFSDPRGKYSVEVMEFPKDQTFNISFDDVDQSQNGSFIPLDTTITFQNPKFKDKTGSWDAGKTQKTLTVKLKPKK